MSENKEMQKEILQLGMLDGKLKELEQQLMLLEKQINELQLCQLALDEIKQVPLETEMFAPISPGVFVKAKLEDNKEVIINTGAKIFCKKNLEEAKKFMQRKLDEALEIYSKISNEVNSIVETMDLLEKEIIKKQNSTSITKI